MSALFYLMRAKFFARIRNVYRRPVSAIITTVALVGMVALGVLMYHLRDDVMAGSAVLSAQVLVSTFSAFILLMAVTMIFQKRTSLLTEEDAVHVLAGPFSSKEILAYILVGSLQGAATISLGTCLYLALFGTVFGADISMTVGLYIGGTMLMYFVLATVDYFYLMSITNPKYQIIKRLCYGAVVLAIAIIAVYYLIDANFEVSVMAQNFIASSSLDYIPLFGWFRVGLLALVQGNLGLFLLAYGGVLAVCIIMSMIVMNYKYDFYEQIMKDAQWYGEVRAKAKEGRGNMAMQAERKVSTVETASFGLGARAISSNIFLQMKKTRNWLGKNEVIMALIYLAIAFFGNLGFTFYQYYILIIVFSSISSDSIMQELKQPYIYLIPDAPLKKLIYLLLPMTMKVAIQVSASLVVGAIVFQAGIWELLAALIQVYGYALVMIAGSVWSIRLLKSRSNAVAEQFIKMGIVILAMLPSIGLTAFMVYHFSESYMQYLNLITAFSLSMNLIVGAILILLAKSLLNGSNVMAE